MRTNSSTPMNENGWSDILNDLRTLFLAVGGGTNDMNFNSVSLNQDATNAGDTSLKRAQNLKDLTNVTEAQANLGLASVVAAVSTGSTGSFFRIENLLSESSGSTTLLSNISLDRVNFHAYGSVTQNAAADPEVAQFNTERSDVGGYYNTATYKWTPIAGKYLVGFNLRFEQSVNSTDSCRAYLEHENGNDYAIGWARRTFINTKYSISASALMQFNGSQYVRVMVGPDAASLSNNTITLDSFWGIRISA